MLKKNKKKNARNAERKKGGTEGRRNREKNVEEQEGRGGGWSHPMSWTAAGPRWAGGGRHPAPPGTRPRLHSRLERGPQTPTDPHPRQGPPHVLLQEPQPRRSSGRALPAGNPPRSGGTTLRPGRVRAPGLGSPSPTLGDSPVRPKPSGPGSPGCGGDRGDPSPAALPPGHLRWSFWSPRFPDHGCLRPPAVPAALRLSSRLQEAAGGPRGLGSAPTLGIWEIPASPAAAALPAGWMLRVRFDSGRASGDYSELWETAGLCSGWTVGTAEPRACPPTPARERTDWRRKLAPGPLRVFAEGLSN